MRTFALSLPVILIAGFAEPSCAVDVSTHCFRAAMNCTGPGMFTFADTGQTYNDTTTTYEDSYYAKAGNQPSFSANTPVTGVIKDNRTGLLWIADMATPSCGTSVCGGGGQATWQNALKYCAACDCDGRQWRLPNIKELASIVNYDATGPANFPEFTPLAWAYAWSSTTVKASAARAVVVEFISGAMNYTFPKTTTNNAYRCVSGP